MPAKKKPINPVLKALLMDFGDVEAVKIAEVLLNFGKKDITDEEIAEKAGYKLNIVRKLLYILNENKITRFRRVRDKKSGWFVYYWNHNFDNLKELLWERRQQVLNHLEDRHNYEKDHYFFKCDKECIKGRRLIFEDAMELNFQCPFCNEGKLIEEPNKENVKILAKTIQNIRTN